MRTVQIRVVSERQTLVYNDDNKRINNSKSDRRGVSFGLKIADSRYKPIGKSSTADIDRKL